MRPIDLACRVIFMRLSFSVSSVTFLAIDTFETHCGHTPILPGGKDNNLNAPVRSGPLGSELHRSSSPRTSLGVLLDLKDLRCSKREL